MENCLASGKDEFIYCRRFRDGVDAGRFWSIREVSEIIISGEIFYLQEGRKRFNYKRKFFKVVRMKMRSKEQLVFKFILRVETVFKESLSFFIEYVLYILK